MAISLLPLLFRQASFFYDELSPMVSINLRGLLDLYSPAKEGAVDHQALQLSPFPGGIDLIPFLQRLQGADALLVQNLAQPGGIKGIGIDTGDYDGKAFSEQKTEIIDLIGLPDGRAAP